MQRPGRPNRGVGAAQSAAKPELPVTEPAKGDFWKKSLPFIYTYDMREHYLDGLRGWAALFVVGSHLGPMFLTQGLLQNIFPFFTDGQMAVYVFFVLSGYVLSIGFFHTGQRNAVVTLALRRYPRLTIPILTTTLLSLLSMKLGLFANIPAGQAASSAWLESFYQFQGSLPGALQFGLWDVYANYDGPTSYNSALWTMWIEMLGSMVIFGLLLLAGQNRIMQLVAIAAFAFWATRHNEHLVAFTLGMLLALCSAQAWIPRNNAAGFCLLAATLPITMLRYMGDSVTALSCYAAAIVFAVLLSPALQAMLSTRLSQWLGRVSFPLYLTHMLIICSLSSAMYLYFGNGNAVSPQEGALIAVVSIAACLFAARLFLPVELAAINVARAFSSLVLQLVRTAARWHRPNNI